MTAIKSNIVSGRQLRAARTLTGLTQAQLSTEAGFAPRACRYWENRDDNPPTTVDGTLEAIEAALRRHGVEIFCQPTPGCRRGRSQRAEQRVGAESS
jgi:transcriptional regulator with XRE-family HTH domain